MDKVYRRLNNQVEASGYHLNPDVEFTKDLVWGLLLNERRYGYWSKEQRDIEREEEKKRAEMMENMEFTGKLSKPVWRCKVCGYLSAMDEPPGVCPICKARKERFERFM